MQGNRLDRISPYRGIITPPAVPQPALDPTEALLDSPVGRVVEGHAGDVCSALGIIGALALVVNHRGARIPSLERIGDRIVMGSMAAAGVDTLIQARNTMVDGGDGSERRGNQRSSWKSVAYAATGLIPGSSLRAIKGLHSHPSAREVVALGGLGVNATVLGYEVLTRGPKIARGEENISGYGSLLASAGGFVVARKLMMRGA